MRCSKTYGMTCVVLAGGRSLRLGRDKAWEEVGGESLLVRVIHHLASLSTEIIVATASGEATCLPPVLKVRTVVDHYPGRGALGGIHAGLSDARYFHSLVVACDMPFLNLGLLRYMMDVCSPYDVVIPRYNGRLEPLHAIYSKRCLEPIRTALESGEHRIVSFFPLVKVRYLDEVEIERFDRDGLSFFNINTQADLDRARTLVRPTFEGTGAEMRQPARNPGSSS